MISDLNTLVLHCYLVSKVSVPLAEFPVLCGEPLSSILKFVNVIL